MTNYELHFSDPESAAALLASACTCFTCPARSGVLGSCVGSCGGDCEAVIFDWLMSEEGNDHGE